MRKLKRRAFFGTVLGGMAVAIGLRRGHEPYLTAWDRAYEKGDLSAITDSRTGTFSLWVHKNDYLDLSIKENRERLMRGRPDCLTLADKVPNCRCLPDLTPAGKVPNLDNLCQAMGKLGEEFRKAGLATGAWSAAMVGPYRSLIAEVAKMEERRITRKARGFRDDTEEMKRGAMASTERLSAFMDRVDAERARGNYPIDGYLIPENFLA